MPQSRQLAAIMFTDIIGYTALMGKDEQKAFELLTHNRQIQKPIIEQFNGRWLKEMGDGVMASFNTASDAVNAAIKIQQTCNSSSDFQLRIGIHLGEVVFENDDVFGDGVNIASRIESMAPAGGIWISEVVQNNVVNKNNIETEYVKTELLKNVKDPIRIYQVKAVGVETIEPAQTSNTENIATTSIHLSKSTTLRIVIPALIILLAIAGFFFIPDWLQRETIGPVSIAIVPFHNQTQDKDFDRYGFGMASEIRTQLALSGQFDFISSDQATLKYSGSNLSPKEIAQELNVDYLLFGSFYQLGDQLKISAELSEASTNKSLWSLPMDLTAKESIDELFSIQAKIAQRIMDWFSLKGKIKTQIPTNNPAAYQYYLEAIENYHKSLPIAGDQYRRAIQLDSNFRAAYLGLFLFEDDKIWFNGNDTVVRPNDLKPILDRIEMLAPDSWETYFAKGVFYYHQMKDYEKGLAFLEKCLAINPGANDALSYAGALNRRRLRHSDALQYILKEIKVNPRAASNWNELALVFADNGNAEDAMRAELVGKRLGMQKDFNFSMIFNLARHDSALYKIPSEVKQYFGTNYQTYLAKEQRNWKRLLAITDTIESNSDYSTLNRNLDKALAYYFTGDLASARIYASKALNLQDQQEWPLRFFLPEDIYILMGENEKALIALERKMDRWKSSSHQGQDKSDICGLTIYKIFLLSFAGKYEEATQELILLNQQYPKWGDYRILFTDFRTDKIRKEYPPFNEALKNLKLPPLLKFSEEYRDM